MQHHIDEFSVSDIRYTLSEVWRVVTNRRWHFVIPFFAVATVAFVASFWAPRTYTATTIIKREHDPVLASMMGKSWTEPYAEIRQRMSTEIASPSLVTDALSELGLIDPSVEAMTAVAGATSPLPTGLVSMVSKGLSVEAIESSPNRDVVRVSLSMSDPRRLADILSACRDEYVQVAKKRSSRVLSDAQRFFTAESERCRSILAGLEKQIIEMETTYPGIDPSTTDPTQAEQTALVVERLELGRRQDELLVERAKVLAFIEGGCIDGLALPFGRSNNIANPRIPELEAELARLQQELYESRTIRLMTEEHPTVIRLVKTIETKEAELASSPIMVPAPGTEPSLADVGATEADRAQARIEEIDHEVLTITGRLAEINQLTAAIDRRRIATADHRENYLKLRQQSEQLREELNGWQANIGPIGHILAVESSNRGIHFTTMQDAILSAKPTSPNGTMLVAICLAIGAGIGALVVLITELMDRSFQTVRQLNSTLGIPVIESIDEIVSEAARRRLILRRFVMMPGLTAVLGLLMSLAGSMAYMSLEFPSGYEQMRRMVGLG